MNTDVDDMRFRLDSLSAGMKAALASSVDSVASPIDEFNSVADGITGDLSNIIITFATRCGQILTFP